jgi:hypothetical protein
MVANGIYEICVEFLDKSGVTQIITVVDTNNKAAFDRVVKEVAGTDLVPTGQVYKNKFIGKDGFHSALSAFRIAAKILAVRIERAVQAFSAPIDIK